MDLEYTNEEIEALKSYKEENNYEAINQLLISNADNDIALLSDGVEKKIITVPYHKEAVIENLKKIKLIYRLCLKYFYKTKHKMEFFYRGTNLAEIERIKAEPFIDRLWSATKYKKDAEEKYASYWDRPIGINICLEKDVPFIDVDEVLGLNEKTNEIIIAPFTKIKHIEEDRERNLENSNLFKSYNIVLEKQKLDELNELERNGLYQYILENSHSIKRKLEECINLEYENTINFENIRKFEQLLAKYENSIEDDESMGNFSNENRTVDYSDVERIRNELEELRKISTNVFEIRKKNINFVNMWKRNIAVYMIAECREIEKDYGNLEIKYYTEQEIEEAKKNCKENNEDNNTNVNNEKENELELENIEKSNINPAKDKENITDIEKISVEEDTKFVSKFEDDVKVEEESELHKRVKSESRENIEAVEKLLSDISKLFEKQQHHAKIAGNMGATYSALNNAFEMKKVAEELLKKVKSIDIKINDLCSREKSDDIELKLELISKSNIEISTLINYLNNPKIAIRDTNINRFDEMTIVEENELKRRIAEKIRYIMGEAELKKLKDDIEIIEDKGTFSRIIGLFTGRNKLDDFMIEQIAIRQNAIRKTLSKKMGIAHNYSIHELMAKITMFVNDNDDDELVKQEIIDLKALAAELRKNFVILESKVQSIVEQKEGRNLPFDKRMTKTEIIENETKIFLNKYDYNTENTIEDEDIIFKDTMSNEIRRIIEYINTSMIL